MDQRAALTKSWDENAGNWTRAVRDRLIPSRMAGTDAAIVNAIVARRPSRLLDVGCGEGWLIRAVRAQVGCDCVGIDASVRLIAEARAADVGGDYRVADYFHIAEAASGGETFDAIVFNYALFDQDVASLLRAFAGLLAAGGVIVIQTLHPGNSTDPDGWRTEDFSAFGSSGWTPMPWYFRSLESWRGTIGEAGLALREIAEPRAGEGSPPLSLLMVCGH